MYDATAALRQLCNSRQRQLDILRKCITAAQRIRGILGAYGS